MLNYIWFGLMAVALVVAAFNGTAEAVTKATVDSATTAVEISIGLVGVMTLWLGILRVAEAAGLRAGVGGDVPGGPSPPPGRGGVCRGHRGQRARPKHRRHATRNQGDG